MNSFEEFWPYYLGEHRHPKTQLFHFLGTSLAITLAIYAFGSGNFYLLFLVPVVGYGFAWFSHFYFEKNKPASFRYPLWSLRADLKLFALLLIGKIKFSDSSR